MIRIAFRYGDHRIFARLVCLLQGGDSAHCEVSARCVSDVHECISSSFLDGGVREKHMPLPAEKWRIYEVEGDPDTAVRWLEKHNGAPYDALGLAGFVIRRIKGMTGSYFCSEVAAEIMGLRDPWRYDLALLESVCAHMGRRVQ